MGHGTIQEGVAEKELGGVELFQLKPVGYETVIRGVDQVKAEIAWHRRQVEKHTKMRNELVAFLAPYLNYRELLNNAPTQTIREGETE